MPDVFILYKDDVEPEAPRSTVPAKMVGKWMYGSFNMIEFWKYDGSYSGPGFQLAVVFSFMEDGHYEYYFAAEANNYGCKTQAFNFPLTAWYKQRARPSAEA